MRPRMTRLIALLISSALLLSLIPTPDDLYAQSQRRCFPETGQCVSGRLLEFWNQNGGLPVFGFPITPQREEVIESQPVQVQWFERNRLELHPKNARPYDVLLGLLGAQLKSDWQSAPKATPRSGCKFFSQTGHNLCEPFLSVWQANGLEFDGRSGVSEAESLALFGLPLTESQPETIHGQRLVVQWFERARFEEHPKNNPPYHVLLGLLGSEFPPPPSQTPTPPMGKPAPSTETIAFQSKRDKYPEIYTIGLDDMDAVRLFEWPDGAQMPAWSSDGTRILFVSEEGGGLGSDLYKTYVGSLGWVRVTNDGSDDTQGSWIPGKNELAFSSNRDGDWEIFTSGEDTDEGAVNLSLHQADDTTPVVSPDGRIAFVSDREGGYWKIFIMNRDGSGVRRLIGGDDNAKYSDPAWSPDGRKLAFASDRERNWDIYVINADGTGLRRLTFEKRDDRRPAWSADGSKIAFQSQRLGNWEIFVMNADGSGPKNVSRNSDADDEFPAWMPTTSSSASLPPSSTDFVPGPDGQIAFTLTINGKQEIYLINADGTDPTPLTINGVNPSRPIPAQTSHTVAPRLQPGIPGSLALINPAWSPDGSKLAFTLKQDNNLDIYVMNVDGSGLTRLTTDPAQDFDPAWSPDGTRIVFSSERLRDDAIFGNRDIYVMNADGSGQQPLTVDPGPDEAPAWSPDGRMIAFQSARDNNRDIYVMNADGSGQRPLTSDPSSDEAPAWSPDGRMIAFQTDRAGRYEIYVMGADGSGQTNLTHDPAHDMFPTWSPNGGYIAFMSNREGNEEIYVMNANGTGQTNLTNRSGSDSSPAWKPTSR